MNGQDLFNKVVARNSAMDRSECISPRAQKKELACRCKTIRVVRRIKFDPTDISWETIRASGQAGQQVNRSEAAVRVTQVQSGLQAVASS